MSNIDKGLLVLSAVLAIFWVLAMVAFAKESVAAYDLRNQAIARGHAEWVANTNTMEVEFRWKEGK